jgi:glutathione peroxidase
MSLQDRGNSVNAHDFSFDGLTGGTVDLAAFKGKPVLVVNTASACGFTPQYKDLQALWTRMKARGLVVIGVPSNDFGAQEPGTAEQIASFCEKNYGVDFPLTAKQKVTGGDAHPFFRWLAQELGEAGAPRWNFHKFLIGPAGDVAGVYGSRVKPDDAELTAKIEELLPA